MEPNFVGVDVAKATLTVWQEGKTVEVKNTKTEVRRFLKGLKPSTVLGIETTSTYHRIVANEAFEKGFTVYLLNPRDCARYRQAVSGRSKTDPIDARCIARYLQREHDSLRPFTPLPKEVEELKCLLKRRATVVEALVKLELSFDGEPALKKAAQPAMKELRSLIAQFEARIAELAESFKEFSQLKGVPGVGVLNAALALSVLSNATFKSADAYVAFAGLDCHAHDSGAAVGKRRLTKRGDRLLRKYLFLAAMSACVLPAWKEFYQRQLKKGLSRIQAVVALARKLARTIWSIYTHKTTFKPERISCQKTT